MDRLKFVAVWLLCMVAVGIFAQSTDQIDNASLVRALDGARTLPDDSAAARTQVGGLFKLKGRVKPEIAEWLIKATAAGLVSIGDKETYAKVRSQMRFPESFESAIFDNCNKCAGTGKGHIKCLKCNGSGRCPNSRCQGGRVIREQLGGGAEEQKCAICEGTGRCKRCRGAGTIAGPCAACGGRGHAIDKDKAREFYETCVANARAAVLGLPVKDGNSSDTGGARATVNPRKPDPQIGDLVAYLRSRANSSLENQDSVTHLIRGLLQNASISLPQFTQYAFDFKSYHTLQDRKTTQIEKGRIFTQMFANGFKSRLWKNYVRCYFAPIPDGLAFSVVDVTTWNYGDSGPEVYCVKLALMSDGHSYTTEQGRAKWSGQPWQSSALLRFLRKDMGIRGYLDLVVPMGKGDVERLKKGTVLTSRGWVYDMKVVDAIATYENGAKRAVKEVGVSRRTQVYRSLQERMEIEEDFDEDDDEEDDEYDEEEEDDDEMEGVTGSSFAR